MKILKILALSIILFRVSVLFFEVYHTYYTDIPGEIEKKNLLISKNFHLKNLKISGVILLFEIILLVSAFLICDNLEIIQTGYVKDGIPILLLLFFTSISERLYFLTINNAISNSFIFTLISIILFKYLNFYTFLFVLVCYYFIDINFLLETNLNKDTPLLNSILPEKIQTWIKDNNYIANVYFNPSYVYNMKIIKSNNILDIFIIGNWSKELFQKSFCSLLFHELGHVYYDTYKYLIYWSLFSIFLLVLGYIFINTIVLSYTKDLSLFYNIFLYVFGNIILLPFFRACVNGYKHYHEFLADNFSVENAGTEGLIEYLNYAKNIDFYTNNSSFLFGLFNSTHPNILERINRLKQNKILLTN